MAIDKLPEFAKDGQKNTDDLVLTDGFPVLKKPARQWFNWLFNTVSLKINEIIDNKIDFENIVDNLTTDDATKPLSARQGKELQDNKLEKTGNAATATKLQNAREINGTLFDGSEDITITDSTKANLNDFANLKSVTGYQRLPNGLILQWGYASVAQAGSVISFPIAFPVSCSIVQTTDEAGIGNVITPTAVSVRNNANFTVWTSTNGTTSTFWFAIGY